MKKIIVLVFGFILFVSCDKKEISIQNIETLKKENSNLKQGIDLLKTELNQYRDFERNIQNEYKISPDSTISVYNDLIERYPNSILKEYSEIRIKNINKNKSFWNENDGWKISKDGILKKPKLNLEKISCE